MAAKRSHFDEKFLPKSSNLKDRELEVKMSAIWGSHFENNKELLKVHVQSF